MNDARKIRIGALAGVVFAIFSLPISDLHTLSDLLLGLMQNADTVAVPRGLDFPFLFTGFIANPILAVSITLFGLGLLAVWKQQKERSALWAAIFSFLSAVSAIFSAIADARYAQAMLLFQSTSDPAQLAAPGLVRGISALTTGVIGGIALTVSLLIFFGRRGNRLGKTGALITLIGVVLGVAAKSLALWILPYAMMVVFLLMMSLKSIGFVLISGGIYLESASNGEKEA